MVVWLCTLKLESGTKSWNLNLMDRYLKIKWKLKQKKKRRNGCMGRGNSLLAQLTTPLDP